MKLTWKSCPFEALSVDQLFGILKLRQDVFIIEQACIYSDIDALDLKAWHIFAMSEEKNAKAEKAHHAVIACARIVPPGEKFAAPSIGRVVTEKLWRQQGIGNQLMRRSVEQIKTLYPGDPIKISAQCQLESFYRQFGFSACSAPYDEDGIDHLDMLLDPDRRID